MRNYITSINISYFLAFAFIFIGNQLISMDWNSNVFFAFWELLYLPVVFGLPIFSVYILWKTSSMNDKSFNIYLSMGLAILALVLFIVKMYFGLVEEIVIF